MVLAFFRLLDANIYSLIFAAHVIALNAHLVELVLIELLCEAAEIIFRHFIFETELDRIVLLVLFFQTFGVRVSRTSLEVLEPR